MAGDWIKMRTNLDTDPAVVRLSSALKTDRFAIVGRLHRVWSWANEHLTDGQDVPVDAAFLDALTETPGFAVALRAVGWLSGRDGSLCFPQFERHNGESAKKRAQDADRKRRVRNSSEKCPPDKRTKSGPEKRREEKNLPSEDISPTPFPDDPPKRDGPPIEFDHVTAESEFLSMWNSTDGTVGYPRNALGSQLSRQFREHVTEDANWLKRARDALAKFPLPFYESIGQPMTLKKFLEETTVDDIIARKFDSSRRDNSAAKGPQIRSGDRHQPGVELGAI